MLAYKLEPLESYKSQIEAQREWWKSQRDSIADELQETSDYECIAALQESYKMAVRRLVYFTKELEICNAQERR